jgi:hypothetical protein
MPKTTGWTWNGKVFASNAAMRHAVRLFCLGKLGDVAGASSCTSPSGRGYWLYIEATPVIKHRKSRTARPPRGNAQ